MKPNSDLKLTARWGLLWVVTATLLTLNGCGSMAARMKMDRSTYCGVGYDLEKVANAEEWSKWDIEGRAGSWPFWLPRGLFWVLDTPLSFTADTILLPADALLSRNSETNQCQDVGQDRPASRSLPVLSTTNSLPSEADSPH